MIDTDRPEDKYKCRQAVKLGIPVVSLSYIQDCLQQDSILHVDSYVITGKTKSSELKKGIIKGMYIIHRQRPAVFEIVIWELQAQTDSGLNQMIRNRVKYS